MLRSRFIEILNRNPAASPLDSAHRLGGPYSSHHAPQRVCLQFRLAYSLAGRTFRASSNQEKIPDPFSGFGGIHAHRHQQTQTPSGKDSQIAPKIAKRLFHRPSCILMSDLRTRIRGLIPYSCPIRQHQLNRRTALKFRVNGKGETNWLGLRLHQSLVLSALTTILKSHKKIFPTPLLHPFPAGAEQPAVVPRRFGAAAGSGRASRPEPRATGRGSRFLCYLHLDCYCNRIDLETAMPKFRGDTFRNQRFKQYVPRLVCLGSGMIADNYYYAGCKSKQ